jgi:serine/threonine protein kinase
VFGRDLKPQNVLGSNSHVGSAQRWILADFGVAEVNSALTSTFTLGAACTPAWSSPEQLDCDHQGEPSDVWSFGVLAWEVMSRQQPWAGKSVVGIITALVTRGERLPMPPPPPASSPFFKDKTHAATRRGLNTLVAGCWQAKPAKRPRFLKVLRTLEALQVEAIRMPGGAAAT